MDHIAEHMNNVTARAAIRARMDRRLPARKGGVDVDTAAYRRSHSKTPRGYGSWIFAPAGGEGMPETWVTRVGMYTEARKQLDAGCWVVMP